MSADYRAPKSGMARDLQKKVEGNYSQEEASKCLYWIKLMVPQTEIPDQPQDIDTEHNSVYELLKDGMILCKLIDSLCPGQLNWNDRTFQVPKIDAMRIMRERERIAMFTKLCVQYGVDQTYTFPTESLHEKGALNLSQVLVCLRQLGVEAQNKPDYNGPPDYWPRKTERNVRNFTEEQLKAGQNVIGLQMGTNKGASQAGIVMGKQRMILD